MFIKFKERTMYKLTKQDQAIIEAVKDMEVAKQIKFGTFLQLKAMIMGLGFNGSKLMLNNLKQDGTFYFSPQECDRMGSILDQAAHKAQLNAKTPSQTVFADARLKASTPDSSMNSSASSVSLGE
jgi:hypothetical protein